MAQQPNPNFPSSEADLIRRDRCPVCRGQHRPATVVDGLEYVRCVACGLTFMDPMPTQSWYDDLYKGEYWESMAERQTRAEEIARRLRKQHLRAICYLRVLAETGPLDEGGTLLEVGCGTGGAVATLADAFGWDAVGIEPDRSSREVATRIGVSLVDRSLEDLSADGPAFDLVLLSHVLEHVVNPHAFLESALSLLRPEGRLVIEVPNGFFNEDLHLFHPYLYTRRSLTTLLSQHGCAARVTAHGGARSRVRRLYLLSVASFGHEIVVSGGRWGFWLSRAWARAWQRNRVLRRVDRHLTDRAVAPDPVLLDRWQRAVIGRGTTEAEGSAR